MDVQIAEVTAIIEDKIKVKFNQDDVASASEYPKLISYTPRIGDKVIMLKTNTSYICLGGIGAEAEEAKEDIYLVGEYKFFAKDKGQMWKGWAKCDGRALSIGSYAELYAEIGTTFGGSGGTFNLPDTKGRVLSDSVGKTLGEKVGVDTVALTANEMPKHTHTLRVSKDPYQGYGHRYAMEAVNSSWAMTDNAIQEVGGGNAHENRQPTLYGGYYYIYTGVM